jgi:serine/threonine protein kinase
MLADQLVAYTLFEHVPGEPLQDVLGKYPQLWVDHIGWITIELASALTMLHSKAHMHLALSPESLLVHFAGERGVPRVTLIDLGLAAPVYTTSAGHQYVLEWYADAARPSDTAPELIAPQTVEDGVAAGLYTDVYGIGVVLYELLAGVPPFSRASIDLEAVKATVAKGLIRELNRADVAPLERLAKQMLSREPNERPKDAGSVVATLKATEIGAVPVVKPSRWPRPERIFLAAAIVLFVAFVIALVPISLDLLRSLGEFFR